MRSFTELLKTSDHFSEEEKETISSGISIKVFNKGELLQEFGDQHGKAFFVKKGLLRSYTIDEKGKEHVFMFGSEGWVVGDFELHTGGSAVLTIDAIEDSEVEVINLEVLSELSQLIPQRDVPVELSRLMNRVKVLQKRIILLMSATAIERYEDFVNTYPDIVQRVPQKMIASYLGVTPEALSKVKSEFLKRN